jgi:hypothetical protein
MWQEFEMQTRPGTTAIVNVMWIVHGGIPLAHGSYTPRSLPLRPIWPGFAINTMFYAGVLWMLFCGPFALRRMIRRRRGQCPACTYPIGQSPVCTECGAPHAVTPKS